MLVLSGKALARWGTVNSADRVIGLSYSNVARVISSHGPFKVSSNSALSSGLSLRPRFYATRAAGRPKAHTGRATASTRKTKTTEPKATSDTATDKPAAKPKAKSKVKAKPKAKPKSRKPKAKKPKRPAKKKVVSEKTKEKLAKQKASAQVKELREKTLKKEEPKRLPENVFQVILNESTKKGSVATVTIKDASAKYKSLAPSDLEVS